MLQSWNYGRPSSQTNAVGVEHAGGRDIGKLWKQSAQVPRADQSRRCARPASGGGPRSIRRTSPARPGSRGCARASAVAAAKPRGNGTAWPIASPPLQAEGPSVERMRPGAARTGCERILCCAAATGIEHKCRSPRSVVRRRRKLAASLVLPLHRVDAEQCASRALHGRDAQGRSGRST